MRQPRGKVSADSVVTTYQRFFSLFDFPHFRFVRFVVTVLASQGKPETTECRDSNSL